MCSSTAKRRRGRGGYDLGGEDYSEDNNKDLIPREIKFHGAKKYSKKIKEELGNYVTIKMLLSTAD